MAAPRSLEHQFQLAQGALREAEHLQRAGYWAACVSHAYQVVLRAAAGLLYGLGANPTTEREVRIGFASAFVAPGHSHARFDAGFRELETLRHRADFDHDHTTNEAEATRARELARAFWDEAQRLRREVLK